MAFQIDAPNAASSLPTPSTAGSPGYFAAGNPALGIPYTTLTQDFMNCLMMEFINAAALSGEAPSKTAYFQIANAISHRGARVVAYATSGTWTVPPYVYSAHITCVGGGGGAGYNSTYAAGGGGGGGTAIKWMNNNLTPNTAISITVGAAGTQALSPGAGSPGGTSSFGAICSATGGAGGGGGTGITNGGGQGGVGVGGDVNLPGGYGTDGIQILTSPGCIGGNGGASFLGGSNRGATGYSFPAPQVAGYGNGGGASGANTSGSGASGNPGQGGCVIIEY